MATTTGPSVASCIDTPAIVTAIRVPPARLQRAVVPVVASLTRHPLTLTIPYVLVGLAVGARDGMLGLLDGLADGSALGAMDGDVDGDREGDDVGASVLSQHDK